MNFQKNIQKNNFNKKISRGIKTLALSAMLAVISPSVYSQNIETKDDKQSRAQTTQVQTSYIIPQKKSINIVAQETNQQVPMHDMYYCIPKYEELHFLRKAQKPTFSSKEVWTFDTGQGTDIFVLDCNNKTIENILDNIDFKDKTIRENLNSGNYKRIEDSQGKEFLEFETSRGKRFFTIQSLDEKTRGAIDIDGTVIYDSLQNKGHKIIRLYIQMGSLISKRDGKPVIRSLDSGEILIPYFDCVKSTKSAVADSIRIDTVFKTKRDTLYVKDSLAKKDLNNLDSLLHENTLKVGVLGSAFVFAKQDDWCQCGEFDFRTRPMLWKMQAYAKMYDKWHMNAKLAHMHAKATFSDTNGENIGNYGINSGNVVIDVRIDPWNSKKLGIGFGGIYNYDAVTQKGSVYDFSIDASNERNSALLGLLMFIHGDKFDNLSIGGYSGYSQRIGTIVNATVRLDDYELIPEVIVDSRLYFELFNGGENFNDGNRGGFEVQVLGPQVLGFLRPTIAYEFEKTLYEGKQNLESGAKHAILIGVSADLGRFLKKYMVSALKNDSINDAKIDSLNNRINLNIDSLRITDSTFAVDSLKTSKPVDSLYRSSIIPRYLLPVDSTRMDSINLNLVPTNSIRKNYSIKQNEYINDSINDSLEDSLNDSLRYNVKLKINDSLIYKDNLPINDSIKVINDSIKDSTKIINPLRIYGEELNKKYNKELNKKYFNSNSGDSRTGLKKQINNKF